MSIGIVIAEFEGQSAKAISMQRIKINTHEGIAYQRSRIIEGKYANFFKVGFNAFEFVMDFGQFYPETEKAELYTRIITGPFYAKNFLETLTAAIKQYETEIGTIRQD